MSRVRIPSLAPNFLRNPQVPQFLLRFCTKLLNFSCKTTVPNPFSVQSDTEESAFDTKDSLSFARFVFAKESEALRFFATVLLYDFRATRPFFRFAKL